MMNYLFCLIFFGFFLSSNSLLLLFSFRTIRILKMISEKKSKRLKTKTVKRSLLKKNAKNIGIAWLL